MKKRTNKDILKMMSNFQKYLDKKPDISKMYLELQMMKFKIRPVQGNLSEINLKNDKFIEVLWSLGKLEEFFQKEFHLLKGKSKDLFERVFNSLYERYQHDLNRINLQWEKSSNRHFLEVEIFKEIKNKKIN